MTNEEAVEIIRFLLNDQLYYQRCGVRSYDDKRETKRRLAFLHAVKALRNQPQRILYLCDGYGCPGCEAGTNPDHECKHTTDIAHAKNFEAMTNEETGEVLGYYEKPEHVIAQINFDKEQQKKFADEAAEKIKEQIESGELVVKESCRPVIIHHNGRDFNGYFDSSRMLLFGSYLAAEVANDFGFTWTEVEEEDENHES